VTIEATPTGFDLKLMLSSIDKLAAQRPVAAHLVAAADADETGAKQLATILSGDVALSGRVMKLANSAYFGMRGKVSSLQLAVTVVGFTTVRTMATVALTDLHDESRLPDDFWTISTRLAVAAAQLAPRFGERPADALCLGVLAQLGSALLYHNDRDGYSTIVESEPSFAGRRKQEASRYGISAVHLTALALQTWSFPPAMLLPLERLDDRSSPAAGLLRASYEVVSRLSITDHRPVPITALTGGRMREEELPEVLYHVRNNAEDLRRLLIGE
jgi:HD-like signal output (HDOD) protein